MPHFKLALNPWPWIIPGAEMAEYHYGAQQSGLGEAKTEFGQRVENAGNQVNNPEVTQIGKDLQTSGQRHSLAGEALSGSANRPLTTWALGAPIRSALSKLPTQFGFSVSRSAAPINPFTRASTLSPALLLRGAGAGVATAGTNLLDKTIGGYGGPQYELGSGSYWEDFTQGLRSSVAGAVGGTPLGPWGAITGAITNPGSKALDMIGEINQIKKDTAYWDHYNSPAEFAKRRDIRYGEIAHDQGTRAALLAGAGLLGATAIGRMLWTWRQKKKQEEASMKRPVAMPFVPKLAATIVDASANVSSNKLLPMSGAGPWLSDYIGANWNAERAGRAHAMAEASGQDTPFTTKYPVTSDALMGLGGGIIGGGIGTYAVRNTTDPITAIAGIAGGAIGGTVLGTILARVRRRNQMKDIAAKFDQTDPSQRRLSVETPSVVKSIFLPFRGFARKGYVDAVAEMNGGPEAETGHVSNALGHVVNLPGQLAGQVGTPLALGAGWWRSFSADSKLRNVLNRKVGGWSWQPDSPLGNPGATAAPRPPAQAPAPMPAPAPQPQQPAAATATQQAAQPTGPGAIAAPAPVMGLPAVQPIKPMAPITAPSAGGAAPSQINGMMPNPTLGLTQPATQPQQSPKRARLFAWV